MVAIAVVASLNGLPWSDHLIGVDGQLFGGGEAGFGYTDLISPRVDSDISDYYYDYQDQVCKLICQSFTPSCTLEFSPLSKHLTGAVGRLHL